MRHHLCVGGVFSLNSRVCVLNQSLCVLLQSSNDIDGTALFGMHTAYALESDALSCFEIGLFLQVSLQFISVESVLYDMLLI